MEPASCWDSALTAMDEGEILTSPPKPVTEYLSRMYDIYGDWLLSHCGL